ncbi:MAG: glutaredoxin family protein [Patescibacteria group bacterium]
MAKKVSIYTTPTCIYCVATKKFFKENDIKYEEHNVASDLVKRQEMIEKTGQMGVPVVMVDDNILVGFNRPKLEELLGM